MNDRYIVYFISSTKKKMTKYIESQLIENELFDLIPSHGNILTNLYDHHKKLTMKEIAKRIGRDKSTVTPLVNKLVKLGYVEKEKSQEDKRTTYLVLTNKGKEIESKFRAISDEVISTAYEGFTEEDKEIFLKYLKRLNNNFDVDVKAT
ncbi:MarR family transcriptional regulator [Vallitalea pronyensis]|uniref:MarR family transcriptional regulator n=1 Tax=Vallitalea pronyensis TaxID=1348613 RepID=A0A8J8SIC6_9FIRM|nr:MarR family transcriptional regulator [Vallitalea pronyensis]QUI24312.1 MarR family transcriptional regulator [Vallitalea pronyensis]